MFKSSVVLTKVFVVWFWSAGSVSSLWEAGPCLATPILLTLGEYTLLIMIGDCFPARRLLRPENLPGPLIGPTFISLLKLAFGAKEDCVVWLWSIVLWWSEPFLVLFRCIMVKVLLRSEEGTLALPVIMGGYWSYLLWLFAPSKFSKNDCDDPARPKKFIAVFDAAALVVRGGSCRRPSTWETSVKPLTTCKSVGDWPEPVNMKP